MAHRLWSEAEVAKATLAPSCQNLQPAGTRPACAFTPDGMVSEKEIATGGCWRSSDAARMAASCEYMFIPCLTFVLAFDSEAETGDEGDDGLLGYLVGIEAD